MSRAVVFAYERKEVLRGVGRVKVTYLGGREVGRKQTTSIDTPSP